MKKSIKLIFVEKNEAQISSFAIGKKTSRSLKKTLFEKKSFELICADTIFKTMCGTFFEVNGSRDS